MRVQRYLFYSISRFPVSRIRHLIYVIENIIMIFNCYSLLYQVSVFDSVVQGGDSVWEGLRVYNGKIFKLEEHLDR